MKPLILILLAFILPSSSFILHAKEKTNILLMMVDDLGYSDFGCYGSEINTPNIDTLASQGLRFTQFYNTAKCHSSRVCLLSGLYEHQAGSSSLSKAVTIAEALKPAGYFTAMAGKWHLKNEPSDRGFERYWGHLSGATDFFKGDNTFRLNGEKWDKFDDDFYTTDANATFAMQFMDEAIAQDKPFFMYIAFNAPHYPLQAKKPDSDKYESVYTAGWDVIRDARFKKQKAIGLFPKSVKLSKKPDFMKDWDTLDDKTKQAQSHKMAVFAGMVDSVDQNIGKLVAYLKRKGVYENTLIMLVSDNGACPFARDKHTEIPTWEGHGHHTYDARWATVGNTPHRFYKQNQFEGGINTPMIAHWPAGLKTKPGSFTRQPAHLIDFMATCLDVAGAEYPGEFEGRTITPLQGRSLLPIFKGKQRKGHEWLYFRFSNDRAIRKGDWKLVSFKSNAWKLFNIAKDRTEMHDIASQHPEIVKELEALWHDVAENIDHAPKKNLKPVSTDTSNFTGSWLPGFSMKKKK